MQIDVYYLLRSFIVPTIAIVVPFIIMGSRLMRHNLELIISKKQIILLILRWIILSVLIFLVLSYLTGDLAYLFLVEPGFGTFDGGVYLNYGEHWNFTFRFYPGYSLLIISMLSGLLYSSIWTLPPICVVTKQISEIEEQKEIGISSGLAASISAIASTTVCCSTSIAVVLVPAITTILGPFVPVLLYISMGILIYSIYTIVIPRFPIINQYQNNSI